MIVEVTIAYGAGGDAFGPEGLRALKGKSLGDGSSGDDDGAGGDCALAGHNLEGRGGRVHR